MELYHINFVEGIPVYRQLVDRLRTNIKNGTLENGAQLPTVRELSQQLSLAQGTVKRAYDELRNENLVRQVQGRGTFVSYQPIDPDSRKSRAMAAIDEMLNQLEALDFSMMETKIFLDLKLRDRELIQENLKVALVECSPEMLSHAAEQMRKIGGIDLFTYVLEDVRRYPYPLTEEMDLIITTMSHAGEVEALVAPKRVSRIALRLHSRCVSQIVKLPDEAQVGIFCGSSRYGELLRQTCLDYTDNVTLHAPHVLGNPDGCQNLRSYDAILVPEGYEKFATQQELDAITAYGEQNPLLFCSFQIDEGSLMYVEDKIRRLHDKQRL